MAPAPKESSDDLERLYPVREVPALTGYAISTLRNMIAKGEIRVIRPPGRRMVRVPHSEVLRLRGER